MNCEQVQASLVSYLDRETTPSEQALIRAHLSGCAACQEELARLSSAQGRIGSALQRRAAHAAPSSQAWERLEARLAQDAQPAPSGFKAWLSRRAPGVSRTRPTQPSSGGATMRNRLILVTSAAVLAVAVVAVTMFNSVTPVSAQQVLERATAAQSARGQGIWHYRIEIYKNPQALAGQQPGTTTVEESYDDMAHDLYRSVTRDAAGNIVEISALDSSFSYWMPKPVDGALPIQRVPYVPDPQKEARKQSGDTADTSATALFDWYRSNPNVELQGKETWTDGSQAYVLVDRSYQTAKLANGQEEKTYTGSTKMAFSADSYNLLETETTLVRDGQEIVIERVRFLVQEALPAGSSVAWDLSDLQGVSFVDQPAEPKIDPQNDPSIPVDITMQELASHPQTYALKTIPAGYSMRIVAAPQQATDQPYAYEIIYTGPGDENIDLMAVGIMDPGFIETSFYDGSYKTAAGLTLNFSSSHPEGSKSTSSMLTTPDGISFLFSGTMTRAELETLAEQIVPLH